MGVSPRPTHADLNADLSADLNADLNAYRIDELARHPWLEALHYFPSLASTNDWALRHGAEACGGGASGGSHATDGAVAVKSAGRPGQATAIGVRPVLVLAGEQTAGRGRGANRWWSANGALTFSLLLELPDWLPPDRRSELALVAGLAVRQAVAVAIDGAQAALVKWPNDVYVGERKVAGILIETAAAKPPRIVVGIGLNVNNSLADAPVDVRARATALIDVTAGQARDRTDVLLSLLDALQAELAFWLESASTSGAANWTAERWRPHCFLTGRTVRIEAAGRSITGRCLGVSRDGELQVQTESGVVACRSGVVTSFDSA